VVGINYPSTGCGRISKHISFTDKESSKLVGQTREYAIRAIQTTNKSISDGDVTSVTVMPYRIPFYVQVSGTVKTVSGTGVDNVRVYFCHIDPATGRNDVNLAFCPLQVFTTDKRGQFEGEIRVSDPSWTNLFEYFNITAEKIEVMPNGATVYHEFIPPTQVLSFSHSIGKASVSFVDNTSVTISGYVRFDPLNVGGNDCPLAGVPVNMLKSTGEVMTVISATDGFYQFSASQGEEVHVYISEFQGHMWNSKLVATTSNITNAPSRSPSAKPTSMPIVSTFSPTISAFTSSPTLRSTMTITIDQNGGILNIAEVQFLQKSVVLRGSMFQFTASSVTPACNASACGPTFANDGDLNTAFSSNPSDKTALLTIVTNAGNAFDQVIVYNRQDCCQSKIVNAKVSVYSG